MILPSANRPNGGSSTRWLGIIDLYIWAALNRDGLVKYDEPDGCAKADDGKSFDDHRLEEDHLDACHQLAAMLKPLKFLVEVLGATKKPTSNLVKPFVGKMIDRLDADKSIVTYYRGKKETIKVLLPAAAAVCCCCPMLLPIVSYVS